MTPDKRRYHREYQRRRRSDPEYRARQNEYARDWKRARLLDPEVRKKEEENWKRKRLKKYGLTPESEKALRDRQDNRCAICRSPLGSGLQVAIDHDHTTGRVRGILCAGCNKGLGNMRDDVVILQNAIQYLQRNLV